MIASRWCRTQIHAIKTGADVERCEVAGNLRVAAGQRVKLGYLRNHTLACTRVRQVLRDSRVFNSFVTSQRNAG
jgi:hypothetical protein